MALTAGRGGSRRLAACLAAALLAAAAQRGAGVPTNLTLNAPVGGSIAGFGGLDKFVLDVNSSASCTGQCAPCGGATAWVWRCARRRGRAGVRRDWAAGSRRGHVATRSVGAAGVLRGGQGGAGGIGGEMAGRGVW
jgi:hypothetical protein